MDFLEAVRQPATVKESLSLAYLLERHGVRLVSGEGRLHAVCPFHPDHDPSLDVYPWRGSLRWGCWVCGIGGDVFDFLIRWHSIRFPVAVEMGAQLAAEQAAAGWKEPVLQGTHEWDPEAAGRVLQSAMSQPEQAILALCEAKRYPYSPEWLRASWSLGGLGASTIIPYWNERLELVGIKHRTPQTKPFSAPGSKLSGVLYGEWKPARPELPVLLTESESDAWRASYDLGDLFDVRALSTGAGSSIKAADKLAGRRVYVAFDGDHAGYEATDRWIPALQERGCEVFRVDMPGGFDMASLPSVAGLRYEVN